jgi:mono/diheme cytochrome c family protein
VENGKGAMPGFKNDLSKEEIAAIIYYVMALSKK